MLIAIQNALHLNGANFEIKFQCLLYVRGSFFIFLEFKALYLMVILTFRKKANWHVNATELELHLESDSSI